jgi:PAS domain S-box-containing protein
MGGKSTDLELKITTWNKTAEQLYGYSAQEALGKIPGELLRSSFSAEQREIALKQISAGPLTVESVHFTKDGRQLVVVGTTVPRRDSQGKIIGYVSVNRDITQQRRAEDELNALNQALEQQVSEKTVEVVESQRQIMERIEAERAHIASEIHDGSMQEIYALIYRLAAVAQQPEFIPVRPELDSLQSGLTQVVINLRTIAQRLLPPSLAAHSLDSAIREHLSSIGTANPDLNIRVDLSDADIKSSENVRLVFYRIFQIAIANTLRHARARQVEVRLYSDAKYYHLEVQDDGEGFTVPESWIDLVRRGHIGLASAQARARSIGGKFEVRSQPGSGTLIRVSVPLTPLV